MNKEVRLPGPMEHQATGYFMSAILFVSNFLLFYFVVSSVFIEITGYLRLGLCWVGSYTMTWVMSLLAKGIARLILTLLFLGLLFIVLMYKP